MKFQELDEGKKGNWFLKSSCKWKKHKDLSQKKEKQNKSLKYRMS